MTYKHLKKLCAEEKFEKADIIFDLIPTDIKSKIIFTVGNRASSCASFLSSAMEQWLIPHSRYICSSNIELKDRFLSCGASVNISKLRNTAEKILRKGKGKIHGKALSFLLSFYLLDGKSEYLIIETDEDFYCDIISKSNLTSYVLILQSLNKLPVDELIRDNAIRAEHTVIYSETEDASEIISTARTNDISLTLSYKSKLSVAKTGLLYSDFYYNGLLYRTRTPDMKNIPCACLAIESANALFDIPYTFIAKGILNAKLPDDMELFSINPIVLFKTGEEDFTLPQEIKCKIIRETDIIETPVENTVFCGNAEFIKTVKNKLK